MYDVYSKHADDFINHEEILETLAYADENKANEALIDSIIPGKSTSEKRTFSQRSVRSSCLPDGRKKSGNLQTGRADQKGFLREPDRHVRTALSVQLLRKRLYILPVSSEKQTYRKKTADPGGNPQRSHCTAGYGA